MISHCTCGCCQNETFNQSYRLEFRTKYMRQNTVKYITVFCMLLVQVTIDIIVLVCLPVVISEAQRRIRSTLIGNGANTFAHAQ